MFVVTMFFPNLPQIVFDQNYYLNDHLKNVKNLLDTLGLIDIEMQIGISDTNPETLPQYHAITNLKFHSIEDIHNAFIKTAKEIISDTSFFTNSKPVFQISKITG